MAARDTVALFLQDSRNAYQDTMRTSALAACERHGLSLHTYDAANGPRKQFEQLIEHIQGPLGPRTLAVMVHPVFDGMHEKAALEAVRAGIGWIFLNRDGLYIEELRRRHPDVAAFAVTPDHHEIGRLQGRVVQKLLPRGGSVLGIFGPLMTTSAQKRAAGMDEIIGQGPVKLTVLRGDWSVAGGEQALASWASRPVESAVPPNVIVCHNDNMALGARNALARLAKERGMPAFERIPIVGCDGVQSFGIELVSGRQITATVVVPSGSSLAVDQIVRWRSSRTLPPAQVLLPVSLYPQLGQLAPPAP